MSILFSSAIRCGCGLGRIPFFSVTLTVGTRFIWLSTRGLISGVLDITHRECLLETLSGERLNVITVHLIVTDRDSSPETLALRILSYAVQAIQRVSRYDRASMTCQYLFKFNKSISLQAPGIKVVYRHMHAYIWSPSILFLYRCSPLDDRLLKIEGEILWNFLFLSPSVVYHNSGPI